ncbi:hypothetical protein [Pacificoceanicola onchidii]|uniref:hypothetical protein n=1 Tax=Pacificoceanicola onchidii TaxID=2562685 RepID=UPI0010A5CDA7|nr:hypothetical protein [Pacificoceanicola onchidii]
MADRINRAFAFPVVAPGGSALVRVTVRLEDGEDGFRFARHCHAPKDTEETVNYFREMTARPFWPEHVQSQRSGVRVTFNPEERRSYVGESYGMLAMLADTLAATRPELFGSDYENGQTDLAIVATGTPDGSGALVLNDEGQNVGGLEAKLRAVLAEGEALFGQHRQKLLVVPRQTHEGEEAALIAALTEGGWTVVETSNLAEALADGLIGAKGRDGGGGTQGPEAKGWLTWPKIALGACAAVALFAFGQWQAQEDALLRVPPAVVADGGGETPAPEPEPVEQTADAAPEPDPEPAEQTADAAPGPEPVVYSGALSVDVQLVRGEKTYDAPVGNPFMPGETVRLTLDHAGQGTAFVVIYRGQVPVKDLALTPGVPQALDFEVRALADRSGKATIAVADCAGADCAAAKARLMEQVGPTRRSYPVGDFSAVRADPDSTLKTVLKFEMM